MVEGCVYSTGKLKCVYDRDGGVLMAEYRTPEKAKKLREEWIDIFSTGEPNVKPEIYETSQVLVVELNPTCHDSGIIERAMSFYHSEYDFAFVDSMDGSGQDISFEDEGSDVKDAADLGVICKKLNIPKIPSGLMFGNN